MKPFDVERLRASMSGLASPAYFQVAFQDIPDGVLNTGGPGGGVDQYNMTARELSFRCQSVDMPGRVIGTASARRNGITRTQIPYGIVSDEPVNVTLLVENGMYTKKLFDRWIKLIGSPTDRSWQPSYFDDIVCKVIIHHFEPNGDKDYSMVLEDAYPTQMSNISADWSSTDEYIQLQVELTYTHWYTVEGSE